MANFLYTLIIYPLIIIIESAYQLVYTILKNEGFAVIGVSIAVSLLCLPLYIVAEKWQQVERNKQKQMENGISRIKETFKGDEQYMILSAFYRENHYHPLMALRSSFGLLIQIPFFMAAYSFLSTLPALQEKSFYFIKDMGKPDAIFSIGNFPINILPIAMTIINIAGSAIYTKGFKLKEKIPIYVMALIFLAILYNSPAGLVLYWTMNNVFSLVKNIFYKLKKPLLVLYMISCVFALSAISYILIIHHGILSKRLVLCAITALLFFTPLFVKAVKWFLDVPLKQLVENSKQRLALFALSTISLALLAGSVIPSYTISSSVVEFMNIDKISNPNFYLYNSFLQSAGIFIFWFTCVYFLFGKKIQTCIAFTCVLLLVWGITNTFAFAGDYGTLSSVLIFDNAVQDSSFIKVINIAALILSAACLTLLLKITKAKTAVIPCCAIILMSFFFISLVNTVKIQNEYKSLASKQVQESDKIEKVFHLSKTQKNVVVFMMDRAANALVSPIFKAYPDLKESYKDFTLYTNTLSYDIHTLLGAPPLYGGYEYTPLEMNKRSSVPLKQKHNESLLLMPRVFTEQANFTAAVSDLSWANYTWVPDMSICDPYPKISGYNLERKYTSKWVNEHPESVKPNASSSAIKRNFLWFALFKECPMILRDSIYDDGNWWASDKNYADMMEFISYYSVLDYLPQMTDFTENDQGSFLLIESQVPHESVELQAPDFVPVKKVTDKGPLEEWKDDYGCISTNTAMYRLVEKWIEYLKQNECYNNTRIILVADHGVGLSGNPDNFFTEDAELSFNPDHNHPLLLVKDFTDETSKNEFRTDSSFMTNADVPSLAFSGIIENPINPFTNYPIVKHSQKEAYGVCSDGMYDPGKNGTYAYTFKNGTLFNVTDDMSKYSNWKGER